MFGKALTAMTRAAFTREAPDVRRQALVAAAEAVLAREGVGGTSVRAICAEAGVSPGLLRHYFEGVDDLIAAAYEAVSQRIDGALDAALAAAGDDPRARLLAYLGASFAPPVLDQRLLAAWVGFWSLVRTKPRMAAIHAASYADFRARLEVLLAKAGARDTRLAAIALTASVDGLWLELCLDPATFSPDEARAIVTRALDGWL
ncbi:TetR/AcrR family transcriptional regulator [Caulobacter vibrioides]|uniref:Transcriptional regulator, TetR family n=2 Tax=Caulobacter vibrioides TaxID=155892 RepID=Q9A3S9_CAUVC|nr:TetR/AcrR family transcriptional regulator [Caulobacter vibrioides]YP_002518596.1 TetR-family transcriptional regulator [Caulobacter vibrioides NA1000]AAK25085.1 transcriptional regulator, TetR family [Caulobacter vibrioides CB15]ACL96688.1 TetR-family transcriptional regulator [Caulobacter vibrioides NA1000]ATC29949.1 TetR family transcriptional regulator [Caulobacter vibrioides]QXZ51472.1 TetR family transcriptional regulator [Caulobacter vibrioides]